MFRLIVDYCSCCLMPADLCKNSPPVSTYEVICPSEEVKEHAHRLDPGA